jgi:hypothetical protein
MCGRASERRTASLPLSVLCRDFNVEQPYRRKTRPCAPQETAAPAALGLRAGRGGGSWAACREVAAGPGPCIRASGTRVPPLPLPADAGLEDVRGTEQPKRLA